MTTSWPWTWQDSAHCEYLNPNNPTIEVLQGQFDWSPKRVLVLGCGDGRSVNGMARRNPKVAFVGVDMNKDYIARAWFNSPPNADFLQYRFDELQPGDVEPVDTVILTGVAGYVAPEDLHTALRAARMLSSPDMRLVFNFPNAMVWREREIYRDAIATVGRDVLAAMRVVEIIACHHPSESVREYGQALLKLESERRHFLFAPHFRPLFLWQAEALLDSHGFALIESRTSALALKSQAVDFIKSEFGWQVYGRKSMQN